MKFEKEFFLLLELYLHNIVVEYIKQNGILAKTQEGRI